MEYFLIKSLQRDHFSECLVEIELLVWREVLNVEKKGFIKTTWMKDTMRAPNGRAVVVGGACCGRVVHASPARVSNILQKYNKRNY
jgi:hypothetical protein